MKVLRVLLRVAVVFGLAVVAARFMFPLPSLDGRSQSRAIAASDQTALGAATLAAAAAHPGTSGVFPLFRGPDAFAARMVLARQAESSIDVQYYIWQEDLTGSVLLGALRDAALRGVRVRLLVDDNGIAGLDPELAALDALEGFEVRLFNPFTLRNPRMASYLFDFTRLNRRMHNKSFTVDGAVSIVGGRNIGDIYFEHGNDAHYFDFDVMAMGPAADDVAANFDDYWASGSAYPISLLVTRTDGGLASLETMIASLAGTVAAAEYRDAVEQSVVVQALIDGTLPLEWVPVTMLTDDPAKGLGEIDRDGLMIARMAEILDHAERSLDIVSAYFVPGERLTGYLTDLAGTGVRVRTLTNSLEATDVPAVHAGYLRGRDLLLDGGVGVFELRSAPERDGSRDPFGIIGSSTTSLHAKTFAIDGARLFVGSFNFDPRSARLNCEMGFLIDSPSMATAMSAQFGANLTAGAYAVTRAEDGGILWTETGPEGTTLYRVEPRTSATERTIVRLLSWLPIAWML